MQAISLGAFFFMSGYQAVARDICIKECTYDLEKRKWFYIWARGLSHASKHEEAGTCKECLEESSKHHCKAYTCSISEAEAEVKPEEE